MNILDSSNKIWNLFILIIITYKSFAFNEIKNKPTDGDLKLVDGGSKKEGTVLVFRGYGWGSICDDHWSIYEANVVCKQLGMEKATAFYTENYFQTYGIKNYFMDDVYCTGNESKISDCHFGGWGRHDCKFNEHVGVQCYRLPDVAPKKVSWNPLEINATKENLLKWKKNKFKIMLEDEEDKFTGIVITEINGFRHPLCPDNYKPSENNVLCKQLRGLLGGVIEKIPLDNVKYSTRKYITRLGRCYGNETSVFECVTYANYDGVPCESDQMLRINCTSVLPDIRADYSETERSSYLEKLSLWHLQCALTEKCLPESIYGIIERNPDSYSYITRNLMRFSSIIENVGNSSFLPSERPEKWEWHGCHLHYHSMKIFATYEVIDSKSHIVATGHKASFCLEDNLCEVGYSPHFRCSNAVDNKGTQGISPGCKDTYFHEYDCQWIDISEINPGIYIFQMIINPQFLVAESNYFNNGLNCTLFYTGYNALLRSCYWKHPYDLM